MKKDKIQKLLDEENRPFAKPEWNWPLDTINLIQTDPLGMYTGIPDDKTEKPQQDADDL